ncbi:GNAT family N-acetyltransferase, partial [Micromonospora sp. NPDC048843]
MPATVHVRELTADDLDAAWELGRFAFGSDPQRPAQATATPAGLTRYGAFDEAGRLVGKAVDLHHDQWWSGRAVSAADVAGVAVAPEARGRGVARAMLTALLRGARERGAAVSALYPTVAAPYRA